MSPNVGEGLNSGLEDSMILLQCLRDNPETAFNEYNSRRIADAQALSEYAIY